LPSCLARCGLVPRHFRRDQNVSVDFVLAIQDYLLQVNQVADQASADVRAGRPASLGLSGIRSLAKSEIYNVALPPLRKVKQRSGPGDENRQPQSPVGLPVQPSLNLWSGLTNLTVSCDGSHSGDDAGWGFTVARPSSSHLLDFCGPVVVDTNSVDFLGATCHSNNVGELTAALLALAWIHYFVPSGATVVLEYDSEYAISAIRGLSRPRTNVQLILRARALLELLSQTILWTKVESHTYQLLNDRADTLAKCGASGISCGVDRLHSTLAYSILGDW